jgi:hypothetical protein
MSDRNGRNGRDEKLAVWKWIAGVLLTIIIAAFGYILGSINSKMADIQDSLKIAIANQQRITILEVRFETMTGDVREIKTNTATIATQNRTLLEQLRQELERR